MSKFHEYKVVPEYLEKEPSVILQVEFEDAEGVKHHITPGHIMTPKQTKRMPAIRYAANPKAYYTIMCMDNIGKVNLPGMENAGSQANHMIVVNIPGGDVSAGEHKSAYFGPGPQKMSGLHRYVFMLFEQKHGKQDFSKMPTLGVPVAMKDFIPRLIESKDIIREYKLGNPIAANFFCAEWDDSVPSMEQMMKASAAAQ